MDGAGEQASWHQAADAPLTTDIAGIARPVSDWVGTTSSPLEAGADFAGAAGLAATGRVATLLVPADHAWGEGRPADPLDVMLRRPAPATDALTVAATALRQARRPLLLIGGAAGRADGVRAAAAVATATGAELLVETFPARLERGAGLPSPVKLAYVPEMSAEQLAGHDVNRRARSSSTSRTPPGWPTSRPLPPPRRTPACR